jgi:uncharacterized protein with gpF-like domain
MSNTILAEWHQARLYAMRMSEAANRVPHERQFSILVARVLNKTAAHVASVYERTRDVDDVTSSIAEQLEAPLREIYADQFIKIERAFGRDANTFIRKASFEDWDPLSSPELVKWNKQRLAKHVTSITRNTRDEIRQAVLSGIDDELSVSAIAKKLRESYSFSGSRALTIAQTEVTAASSAGRRHAVIANVPSPEDLWRIWLSAGDKRTRQTHKRASGQRKKFNEPFLVGASRLMFPGDTSLGASSKEIVRCRCTEYYAR